MLIGKYKAHTDIYQVDVWDIATLMKLTQTRRSIALVMTLKNSLHFFLLIRCHSMPKLWENSVHFLCARIKCFRIKDLAFLYILVNEISAPNMEADSCEGVKIDPVVRSNPYLHCGVTHKVDCGVDKIPLIKSATLIVHGVSKHLLIVESLS